MGLRSACLWHHRAPVSPAAAVKLRRFYRRTVATSQTEEETVRMGRFAASSGTIRLLA